MMHPDRLLPAEPGERAIARWLYEAVRDLPVISAHGHVDPRLLLDDEPFPDPATLLVAFTVDETVRSRESRHWPGSTRACTPGCRGGSSTLPTPSGGFLPT